MDINEEIIVLDESLISNIFETKEDIDKPQEGLVEQVVRKVDTYEITPETPEVKDLNLNESEVDEPEIDKPEKKKVLTLEGDDTIRITSFPFIIGKSKDATFTIKGDTFVSRKHCCITRIGENYYIEDMNSLNGTFVNDEEIHSPIKLKEGMDIIIADRNYKVTWQD